MSDAAAPAPPSPVPERAWSGRSWWTTCCMGCCLGFLVLGILAAVFGWLGRSIGWRDFASYPGKILDRARGSIQR